MKMYCYGLSPENFSLQTESHIGQIADWWSQLRIGNDSGTTTWKVLDSLERQVMGCLTRDPPDLPKAESLTAKAALLMIGGCND